MCSGGQKTNCVLNGWDNNVGFSWARSSPEASRPGATASDHRSCVAVNCFPKHSGHGVRQKHGVLSPITGVMAPAPRQVHSCRHIPGNTTGQQKLEHVLRCSVVQRGYVLECCWCVHDSFFLMFFPFSLFKKLVGKGCRTWRKSVVSDDVEELIDMTVTPPSNFAEALPAPGAPRRARPWERGGEGGGLWEDDIKCSNRHGV